MTQAALLELAKGLSEAERSALKNWATCTSDARRRLVAIGLACWSTRPGHRFPSMKLSNRGYAVRDILTRSAQAEGLASL